VVVHLLSHSLGAVLLAVVARWLRRGVEEEEVVLGQEEAESG
jgi:hypothetical protein